MVEVGAHALQKHLLFVRQSVFVMTVYVAYRWVSRSSVVDAL